MIPSQLLQNLSESPSVHRLGWSLLHSLWEGAAVAVLLALALAALRRSSPQARYLAACAALLALCACPAVTYLLLDDVKPPPATVHAATPDTVAPHGAPPVISTVSPDLAPAQRTAPEAVPPDVTRTQDRAAAVSSAAPAPAPDRATALDALLAHSRRLLDALQPALPWLVLTWLAGVGALSIWNLGGWLSVQRLKRRTTSAVDATTESRAATIARRLGLTGPVRLAASALIDSPLVIGALKPIILLPASLLSDLPPHELEALLAHELAHVRRRDYLVNLLQAVAESLLFYHPAVWWVSRRIRAEREHCCDDLAVSVTRDRTTYVRALAAVAQTAMHTPALAPAASSGVLLRRIRRLLGEASPREGPSPSWLAGAAALAVAATAFLTVAPIGSRSHAAEPSAEKAGDAKKTDDAGDGPKMIVRVIDGATGRPISGATVKVSGRERDKPDVRPLPSRTYTTTADGSAAVPLGTFRRDLVRVSATKDGFTRRDAEWKGEEDGRHLPETYQAKLEPAHAIGGVVKGPDGAPVANAEVEASTFYQDEYGGYFGEYTNLRDKAWTGADGRWQIGGAPADLAQVRVEIRHPQFLTAQMWGRSDQAKLLARVADVVLAKGLTLSGRVTDEQGKPIVGAQVITDAQTWGSRKEAWTGADGRYEFTNVGPDATVVMARGKGFGPVLREVEPGKSAGDSINFTLRPAREFGGQVVDSKGAPIAGVRVLTRSLGAVEVGSQLMDATTDADGRFRIDGSDQPLVLEVFREGYMRLWGHRLEPQDGPHKLRMLKPLRFTGTVTDAATGEPIKNFRVTPGWGSSGGSVAWDTRDVKPAFDGRYTLDIDFPRDTHLVKVEADGYIPATSKEIAYGLNGDESPVTFDAKLVRSAPAPGLVLKPDGQRAAGAVVVVATTDSQTTIANGRVEPRQNNSRNTTANHEGIFEVAPTDATYTLLVFHDAGFAKVPRAAFEKAGSVRLQPWARVEGVLKIGAKVGASEKVSLNDGLTSFDPGEPRVHTSNVVNTDVEGRFVFDRVYPGKGSVGRYAMLGSGRGLYTYGNTVSERFEAAPGQTVRVNVGGGGRPLVGRVLLPDPAKLPQGWKLNPGRLSTKVTPPARPYPEGFASMSKEEKSAWHAKWRESDEGKALLADYDRRSDARRYHSFAVNEDGSFRVDDVTPGVYELSVDIEIVRRGTTAAFDISQGGDGRMVVTVPEVPGGRSDEPLDIGAVAITMSKSPAVGDPAPAFSVKTVDGKPLSLADYKGKYVLLDFWATWCGPCVAEVPHLKAVYEAFGKDERFVMIGLSLDDAANEPKVFAEKNGLPWVQGFLGDWSQATVPTEFGVQGIPATWLIGPDGKVVAKNLRGDGIRRAVADALSR